MGMFGNRTREGKQYNYIIISNIILKKSRKSELITSTRALHLLLLPEVPDAVTSPECDLEL